ncbi:mechanosensitive ion channel family protein [Oscillibacter ruminantium]|uniref:mechanosensitive ion channel family protein n=1 Tax=Oscillibacter ruminantium TaxID=1263547 RepID=UPI002B1EB212|nr:mechanosensitive ion channel family protein [Oscillibacter ruminantium]MEA5041898.1 mechanosensitive ion channel family protein [Oscillibacter ruminantium]
MKEFEAFLQTSIPGMKLTISELFSAVVTLLVCLLVIRVVMKLLRSLIRRTKLDDRVQKYLLMALRLVLYAIAVIIVLGALNVDATSLVALLSVASLGITLAAEDILGNVAGGLVLLSSRPFVIGDFIEADGVSGTVEEITLNRTKLITPEGLTVLVPNKALSSSKLTNYTALGRRRVCRKVTASYDAPTQAVKAACLLALERTGDQLTDPAPSVYLTDYQSSAIEYSVYCWCTPEHYWGVYLSLGENLRDAFAEKGVEMTYNHLNVHILGERESGFARKTGTVGLEEK